ncbi:unnamed protein product [Didymodactylos carnosus]|uniref:Uncharacterized protein n=1 Tax=Didymodactylos carnosus TaxID=1234261 RepID=A0A813PXC6_9BILA|nr:unnamed protein product [Didymodactylos carnosus]CAF1072573.1 unnamed protein product [Didymodactylos carnosus]CAF3535295.1 unnamed protein product [Didymodactylos carnosus]CAF3836701.1 unnamed protein product [Didymodactylos carnosus]
MVYSRSETNLTNIFINLCTSSNVIKSKNLKQNYQRRYPPLKPLTILRSNSCSDLITDKQRDSSQSLTDNIKHKKLSFDNHLSYENQINNSSTIDIDKESMPGQSLISNDFTLSDSSQQKYSFSITTASQSPSSPIISSDFSFRKRSFPDINDAVASLSIPHDHIDTTSQLSHETKSTQIKNDDYIFRLQHRYKSREHLRKAFLS